MNPSDPSPTIRGPDASLAEALDFRALQRIGLEAIARTGSAHWTDFNEHDPGITILEVLSFALTDLGYRAEFPIEDLLAPEAGGGLDPEGNGFHTARRILTASPVTLADFRRLVVDVPGVRNAWVEQWPDPLNPIRGLLRIRVDPTPDLAARLRPLDALDGVPGADLDRVLGAGLDAWNAAAGQEPPTVPDDFARALLVIWGFPETNLTELVRVLRAFVGVSRAAMDELVAWVAYLRQAGPRLDGEERRDLVERTAATLVASRLLPESTWEPRGLRQALGAILEAGKVRSDLVGRIREVFWRHRGLGQDLVQVLVRRAAVVTFSFELRPVPGADLASTAARVLLVLEGFLNRPVRFLTQEQALAACGGEVGTLFDGPALRHGFLSESTLLDPPPVLHAAELQRALEEIPEVAWISDLRMAASPAAHPDINPVWLGELRFPEDVRPELAPANRHRIRPSVAAMELRQAVDDSRHREGEFRLAPRDRDWPIPQGTFRDPGHYVSVQRDFPSLYGLEPNALPASVGAERLSEVKQLQAYLLIFDQILANFHAQLAHLGSLFSWDPAVRQTCFTQGLTSAVGALADLLLDYPLALPSDSAARERVLERARQGYLRKLAAMREDPSTFVRRRNEFLDHLLFRFGRSLDDFTLYLRDERPGSHGEESIRVKQSMLADYCALSSGRGCGERHGFEDPIRDQYSGLRRWIATALDFPTETTATQEFLGRFVGAPREGDNPARPATSRYALGTVDGTAIDVREITRFGRDLNRYTVQPPKLPEEGYRLFLQRPPSAAYRVDEVFPDADSAFAARRDLCDFVRKYDRASERVDLVEHVLLRPGPDEAVYGLRLLDGGGRVWMSTPDWHRLAAFEPIGPRNDEGAIGYIVELPEGAETKVVRPGERATIVPPQPPTPPPEGASSAPLEIRFRFGLEPAPEGGAAGFTLSLRFGLGTEAVELSSVERYPTSAEAGIAIDAWMEAAAANRFGAQNREIFCRPIVEAAGSSWPEAVLRDPYSGVASLVIPDWPSRFQDPSFAARLATTVLREAPAHVWVQPVWLEHGEYQRFNQLFLTWRRRMSEPGPARDLAARELLAFLMQPRAGR
jgi:hypothetical protein